MFSGLAQKYLPLYGGFCGISNPIPNLVVRIPELSTVQSTVVGESTSIRSKEVLFHWSEEDMDTVPRTLGVWVWSMRALVVNVFFTGTSINDGFIDRLIVRTRTLSILGSLLLLAFTFLPLARV